MVFLKTLLLPLAFVAATAVGNGWLWVDGKRIYSATGLAMRLVPGE